MESLDWTNFLLGATLAGFLGGYLCGKRASAWGATLASRSAPRVPPEESAGQPDEEEEEEDSNGEEEKDGSRIKAKKLPGEKKHSRYVNLK